MAEKSRVALNTTITELKKENLFRLYEELELPLITIIERAQTKGILVDVSYLAKLGKEYHSKLTRAESAIYEYAGEVFNINSPKQLGVILFDTLGLKVKGLKKTEGGARSTRESELVKLKESSEKSAYANFDLKIKLEHFLEDWHRRFLIVSQSLKRLGIGPTIRMLISKIMLKLKKWIKIERLAAHD